MNHEPLSLEERRKIARDIIVGTDWNLYHKYGNANRTKILKSMEHLLKRWRLGKESIL